VTSPDTSFLLMAPATDFIVKFRKAATPQPTILLARPTAPLIPGIHWGEIFSPASFKDFGFGYRKSRNEMLEDKRPAWVSAPTSRSLVRQRREQSRIQLARRIQLGRLIGSAPYFAGDPFALDEAIAIASTVVNCE
jgi:hypothetical protein